MLGYTTNIYTLLQISFFTTAVTVLLEYFDCLLGLYNCMRSTSQPSEPSLRVSQYLNQNTLGVKKGAAKN